MLAQVQPGESVLVHAAAGRSGYGGAVQLARLWGLEGFHATAAGIRGKWDTRCTQWDVTTRMLPIHTGIRGDVLADHRSRGVDVVLNSLAT